MMLRPDCDQWPGGAPDCSAGAGARRDPVNRAGSTHVLAQHPVDNGPTVSIHQS